MQTGGEPRVEQFVEVPVHVGVLVKAEQLQLEARQYVPNHKPVIILKILNYFGVIVIFISLDVRVRMCL